MLSSRAVATWKSRVFDSSNKNPKRVTKRIKVILRAYAVQQDYVQLNCVTPKNNFAGFWVLISSPVL